MRLAAIYLKEHEYIFSEPQTINFGGEYIYSFQQLGNKVYVKRDKNQNYILGFFDQTKLSSRIELISAIVGKNGTGKSSVLDIIRSFFIKNAYGLPYSYSVALFENDNENLPLVLHSDFNSVEYRFNIDELEKAGDFELLSKELPKLKINEIQTLLYSPHFDYKYNYNFDEIDVYDLSFDKILERDLHDLENKDANSNGWNYSPAQELIFKNSIRQLLFLSSDLVKKNKIFKNIFDLPNHGEAKLFFRGHTKKDPWNTPNEFRWALKIVKEKLEKEIDDWHKGRVFDSENKVINQIDINKYLVKRYVIRDIISVLERQMEKKNSYLSEGKISLKNFEEDVLNIAAYETFLVFIKNSKIQIQNSTWDAFDYNSIYILLNTLYGYIDEIEQEEFVENDSIQIEPLKVVNILKLHRNFLLNIFSYYPKLQLRDQEEALFDKSNRIEGFINYFPTTKKLSSGENALLNLFSRFYDFIINNLAEESKFLPDKKHYIILLDEADLSFHPSWKRKFVKSLILTIPYFFHKLKFPPTLQIIFTTHDPLTLSDIPQINVVCLDKNIDDIAFVNHNKMQTFGANVHDLLAHSFFLENGFIGEFAEGMIKSLISYLSEDELKIGSTIYFDWDKENSQKFINTLDEPFIKDSLLNLFNRKFLFNEKESLLEKRAEIDARLNELKNEED